MPELPEVETIKRDLSRLIVGKKILDITTDSSKQVQPSLAAVKRAAVGAKIKKIERRAKLLQIFLSNGQILAVHLKLTGRLLVRRKDAPGDDWQRITIALSGNKELRFADLRRFGWIRLVNSNQLSAISGRLGVEPLTKEFTPEKLGEILIKTKRPIKLVLMDQGKIAGVGNIYANDALFEAGIMPTRPANTLNQGMARKLHRSIEKVLEDGLKYGGSSAKDEAYIKPTGEPGSYQKHFRVYQKEGQPCPKCGKTIKRIKFGGRGTFFCPRCQK